MPKKTRKPVPRKIILRLPDLDHAKSSVLNSLTSPRSRRNYKCDGAIHHLVLLRTETCSEPDSSPTIPPF